MAPTNKRVSQGTIDMLKGLLRDAEEGDLIGIAFVSIERQRKPGFGWAGAGGQYPYFTAGALQKLIQLLLDKAEGK